MDPVDASLIGGLIFGILIGVCARILVEAMRPGSPGEHA